MIDNDQRNRRLSQHSLTPSSYATHVNVYRNQMMGFGSQKPNKKHHHKFALFLVLVAIITLGAHVLWAKHVSAEEVATHQAQVAATAIANKKATVFTGQVNTLIAANSSITFGITTISTFNGVQQYGSQSATDGASTAKLLTAADYLHHVDNGSATLDQNIDGQTAQYWLQIMLVNSDDNAWAELNNYLTHADLVRYANSIGFTNYDPDANTFTPTDVAVLLQKLYDHQLLNNADRSLMLSYLLLANYRSYIVPAVPSGDTVYHKVGLDEDDVNDAAIITNGDRHMILVIFTDGNGTYDWTTRAQLMQTITQDALAAYL